MKQYLSTTHEERYFHVYVDEGGWDSPVYGIRKTVFARKEKDGMWYATASRCNPGDQFSRKVGRTVARRRYFQWGGGMLRNACLLPCTDPAKGPLVADAHRFASPKSNMADNNMDEVPSIANFILGRR